MAAIRGPRLQVGSAAWVAEERSSALQIVDSEVEEFSYSARNEMDWLNEHMADIFDENETNFADTFKTPGKLRGKTPRTVRRPVAAEGRVPLSDMFAATPNIPTSHFSPRLNHAKSPQALRDTAANSPETHRSSSPRRGAAAPKVNQALPDIQDSGYYGSQDMAPGSQSFREASRSLHHTVLHSTTNVPVRLSPVRALPGESPEKTFQTAREEQTTRVLSDEMTKPMVVDVQAVISPVAESVVSSPLQNVGSDRVTQPVIMEEKNSDAENTDVETSPSETSSPIRPMVRKSSLNFASLPAREPLPAVKANGGRVSRVSHLDHNRMSYYSRPTGGKSLGNVTVHGSNEMDDEVEATAEAAQPGTAQAKYEDLAANHHKTYTQRLQDQISMLGKSQPHVERSSKSVSDGVPAHMIATNAIQTAQTPKSPSPLPMSALKSTPGAFPEDEDDWIEAPSAPQQPEMPFSPRPALPKSHSADIMEGLHQSAVAGESMELFLSPQRQTVHETQRPVSSLESSSTTHAPGISPLGAETVPLQKAVTIAGIPLGSSDTTSVAGVAPKSPARSYRDSPLKQLKNKMSSILKGSKVLIASGAALSAEGKSSILSPSMTRLGHFAGPSMESVAEKPIFSREPESQVDVALTDASPTRPAGKRTRASIEKEKEDKKRDKGTRRMEEQFEKLEKARAQEREKVRDFSREKEEGLQVQKTPKATRSSPRKPRALEENTTKHADVDAEMVDAPSSLPQPAPKSVGPASALRTRELKRPIKPVKESLSKSRQAPTVIRVNTGSQHSQYLTSNNTASAPPVEPDTSMQSLQNQPQLTSKASKASLQSKASTQNLRAAASAGRQKALDAATKKKEQDEREALRRREAKADLERKRIAAQEEQRKVEQAKKQELERQKQKEREHLTQAEAKKNAQRQAAIEKAKQTRAPPPAVRGHPQGAQDFTPHQDKRVSALAAMKADGPRPPSRMASGLPRSQDEPLRSTTSHATKIGAKRALPAEPAEDLYKTGQGRTAPSYQAKDAKRRRTSEEFDDRHDVDNPPNIKGPPVRPSGGFKKDIPTKPAYPTSYTNAPQSATRDLFKATVTAQHHSQSKPAHPLDMAQISKGAIPFAPHASTATGHPTKTPVRTPAVNGMKASAARSAAKPSPKFQNGEAIELPEIQTDDEDEDEDDARGMVAAWADSPELRQALLTQETLDPSQIFGPPRPLNMEEVFFKSKEKFHKFRSRTSSANWTGADRLTEEDIRKDLAARDKLRREGGWTYEMSKNLL